MITCLNALHPGLRPLAGWHTWPPTQRYQTGRWGLSPIFSLFSLAGVSAAEKYLFAVLDALGSVAELDETNNMPLTGPVP